MAFRKLDDLGDVVGKVALVRVDFNLPMKDGAVTEDTRVRAAAPTILELADKGAKVLLLAHFGRPKGSACPDQSLSLVIGAVEKVLGREVMFVPEIAGDVVKQAVGICSRAASPAWKTPVSGRARKRTTPNW
jgi:phosphoglycerate kinase